MAAAAAAAAEWSNLGDDLSVEIAKRIRVYEDFVCFGGVCRSWQAAAVMRNFGYASSQIPWLMLPPRKTCSNFDDRYLRSFFSISTGKTRDVYLPEINEGKRYLSSKGWLLIIAQNLSMSLLHPFSRTRRINLPLFQDFEDLETRNNQLRFIRKCALSADPSSTADYVFMIIHGALGKLAYYKPGNKAWTTIQERKTAYRDLAYCNGRFYAIDWSNRLVACDFRGGGDDPVMATVVSNIPRQKFLKAYVVESAGSLLVLTRMIKIKFGKYRKKRFQKTFGFQVFQLDFDTNTWSEVEDLGNRTIFLGHNSSFSLEASDDKCRSNCIYFTDDDSFFHMMNREGGGKDIGIYNMKDGNIDEYLLGNFFHGRNPPMWV